MPLVEQELPTLPEHLSSRPIFSGVRVTRSLVLCSFVDLCLSFCTFSLGHYVVYSSMLYNINLQALLYTTPLFTDIENDMVCKYLANTGSVKVW